MPAINISVKTIQLRRNTNAYWTSSGITPDAGEPIYSTDTNELRIGDGSTPWTGLTPITGGGGGSVTQEEVEDYVGALITGTAYVTATYNDVAGSLTVDLASAYKTILDNTSNINTGDETGSGIVSKIDTELGQTDWKASVSIPTGGSTGQVLKKVSNANYDYSWQNDTDTDTTAAAGISITDSGAYFTGTDVEAALQEIGAGGIGGGDTITVNDYQVETPSGAINDVNTTYTTLQGSYKSGTLIAYLNNQPITVGEGLTEGNPSLGTFDISPAPATGDTLYVTYVTVDAGTLVQGETNTASNLTGDEGIFASKVSADLRFKSLTAGSNITLSSDANSITISATGGGGGGGTVDVVSNVAQDTILGRVSAGSGDSEELTATQVRTLLNIEDGATADQSDSEIKTAYENNADTNAFTDAEQTTVGYLTVTQAVDLDTMESNITTNNAKVSADGSINTHSDVTIGAATSSSNATLRVLADTNTDGTYTVVDWTPPTGGSGEVNTASNLGAGTGIFTTKSGVDLPFKSLVGGTNISLTNDANTITITNDIDTSLYALLAGADFTGDITTTGDMTVSAAGNVSGVIANAANLGFDNFTSTGETAKFTFGDDNNSIVNSFGNGMGIRSYWTMYFDGYHQGGVASDADDYPSISGVGYQFILRGSNAGSRGIKLYPPSGSWSGNYIEAVDSGDTEVFTIDSTGLFNGTVAYDNTSSGLAATTTQAAIDEVEARVDANDAKVTENNKATYILNLSDYTTDLTTGTTKAYFRVPYACTLTAVRASVLTAPTGSGITVDINENGTSILSTKLTIDATEKTSTTAATAAVISDSALAADAEMTFDIDAIGSTIAGAGLQVQVDIERV